MRKLGLLFILSSFTASALFAAAPAASPFIRGDANQDKNHDIADAIKTLNYLFLGEVSSCLKALDINDDGNVDVADPIYLLTYLFAGGTPPPAPFPDCGMDPTADSLTCVSFAGCEVTEVTITGITPNHGPASGGTAVVITGSGFDAPNCRAYLCGRALTDLRVVSDTRIEATTPRGTGGQTCDLVVRNDNGQAVLPAAFTYDAVLEITSIDPTSGPPEGGTEVTITGAGFSGANLEVYLCDKRMESVQVLDVTRIRAITPIAPEPDSYCDLRVTNAYGSATLEDAFFYEPITCYTEEDIQALIDQEIGQPQCLPSPVYEDDIDFGWPIGTVHVVVCPEGCCQCSDSTPGCEVVVQDVDVDINWQERTIHAVGEGSASDWVVQVGNTNCNVDAQGTVVADMHFALEETPWEGVYKVTDVSDLVFQVTDFNIDASGGLICAALAAADELMRQQLEDELNNRSDEFLDQIREDLVGQYVCPP